MQFKLRSLFVVTAVISAYCGIVFALPPIASLLVLCVLTTLLPPVIVGGIVYGRGAVRAFWIGCAASGFIPFLVAAYLGFAVAISLMDVNGGDEEAQWYIFTVAICHALVVANGLLVVGSRWLHSPGKVDQVASATQRYAVMHRRITLEDHLSEPAAVLDVTTRRPAE